MSPSIPVIRAAASPKQHQGNAVIRTARAFSANVRPEVCIEVVLTIDCYIHRLQYRTKWEDYNACHGYGRHSHCCWYL